MPDPTPPKRSGMVATAGKKAGSVGMRFLVRFAVWTTIIGLLASTTSAALWSQVYDEFGLPLSIGQESVYQAVLFGAAVASVVGGAAVALAGMIWKA